MSLTCKKITTTEEKERARSIVEHEYLKMGYLTQTGTTLPSIPSTPYLREATSETYALSLDKKIIGTISIIMDSVHGVPMDALFKDELDVLRKKNEHLAEVVQLAIDETIFTQSGILKKNIERLRFLTSLFQAVLRSAHRAHISALCIMINPKHDSFYEHLGFRTIGKERLYPSLENAPAIPKALVLKNKLGSVVKSQILSQILHI